MTESTLNIIATVLKGDATVTAKDRADIMHYLRAPQKRQEPITAVPARPQILRRRDVAKMFNRSLRFVDLLAQTGRLTKVKLPGSKRAAGFLESDVTKLMRSGLEDA